MTQSPRIFHQQYPLADVDTNLMTVDISHSAQLSVFIANHSTSEDTISVALVPYSEPNTTPPNYIAYQTRIAGNGVLAFSGLFLASQDQIRVTSGNGTTSFTATGIDIY
jgi:hypothetical protein